MSTRLLGYFVSYGLMKSFSFASSRQIFISLFNIVETLNALKQIANLMDDRVNNFEDLLLQKH